MPRKTSYVHFVNHGAGGRALQRPVAFPVIVAGIDGDALHRGAPRCAAVARRNCHGARIWVEQNAACIEPVSIRRDPTAHGLRYPYNWPALIPGTKTCQ